MYPHLGEVSPNTGTLTEDAFYVLRLAKVEEYRLDDMRLQPPGLLCLTPGVDFVFGQPAKTPFAGMIIFPIGLDVLTISWCHNFSEARAAAQSCCASYRTASDQLHVKKTPPSSPALSFQVEASIASSRRATKKADCLSLRS